MLPLFKPIEIIQTELHNRLTPREKEDQLHAELRGEEHEFTIEIDEEPRDLKLSIENLGIAPNDCVKIGLRLQNYELPTSREEWEEDVIYIYINSFLRGQASAELANPLMADLSVGGYSAQDIRISFLVSTTAKSGIWDAVGRVAFIISKYHEEWFENLREIREEWSECYFDEGEDMPLEVATEMAASSEDQNILQRYSMVRDYIQYKDEDEQEEDREMNGGSAI